MPGQEHCGADSDSKASAGNKETAAPLSFSISAAFPFHFRIGMKPVVYKTFYWIASVAFLVHPSVGTLITLHDLTTAFMKTIFCLP